MQFTRATDAYLAYIKYQRCLSRIDADKEQSPAHGCAGLLLDRAKAYFDVLSTLSRSFCHWAWVYMLSRCTLVKRWVLKSKWPDQSCSILPA